MPEWLFLPLILAGVYLAGAVTTIFALVIFIKLGPRDDAPE